MSWPRPWRPSGSPTTASSAPTAAATATRGWCGWTTAAPGGADDVDPRSLVAADPEEVAARIAEVVREVRPQVVVTYEPGGGYGHPDHVRVHEATLRALVLAAGDGARGAEGAPWQVAKVYEVTGDAAAATTVVASQGAAEGQGGGVARARDPGGRARGRLRAQQRRSSPADGHGALRSRRRRWPPRPPAPGDGRESDLFAGVG